MVNIGLIHYIYLLLIIIIVITMSLKKDVVLPCILGIGLIGFLSTGNLLKTVQILYNAVYISGKEFLDIVIIISLVNAMSKALTATGADILMIEPVRKLMVNSTAAFFVLGITMLLVSWFIWPTPAVGFLGAIMVPAAVSAGLPSIWAAASMNIFGNGTALSSDYFIQGAPSITARTAAVDDPMDIMKASIPLWLLMSVTTIFISFFNMKKHRGIIEDEDLIVEYNSSNVEISFGSKIIAAATPLLFMGDVVLLYAYGLKGGEATALIGGTAVIILTGALLIKYKLKGALAETAALIRDGAMQSMKVFAPVIIIGAFFFLGSRVTASEILGIDTGGFLTELGIYISGKIPLTKFSIILMVASVSALLGVSGSGFAGLPLIGTLAAVFSSAFPINKAGLAALGQIITIWVGGGTIIPWRLAPISAVCKVDSFEIVKRNLLPVGMGIAVTVIGAMLIL